MHKKTYAQKLYAKKAPGIIAKANRSPGHYVKAMARILYLGVNI